jgi:hypothetical protein
MTGTADSTDFSFISMFHDYPRKNLGENIHQKYPVISDSMGLD